jgi:hypothetical protein
MLVGCQADIETSEAKSFEEKQAEVENVLHGGEVVESEKIGDGSELLTVQDRGRVFQRIKYVKNGQEKVSTFMPELRPSLDWLKNNTPKDAVIMSWWDYGPMIEGYAQRTPVIDAPSRKLLRTVAMYQDFTDEELQKIPGNFTPEQKIYDVTSVMVHKYMGAVREIMDAYGADYLYITKRDIFLIYVFEYVLGGELEYTDYKNPETGQYEFPQEMRDSVLFFAVNNRPLPTFELVYFDDYVTIYKK